MIDQDYVIQLLAAGVPTAQIAAAVGCDPSYISQLKQDENIQLKVSAKQADATIEDINFDSLLEKAEQMALERIQKSLPYANLSQSVLAFKVLNGARRRNDAFAQQNIPQVQNVVVNLTLPTTAMPRYITNEKNEIIEVEGQTMLSASPKSLDQFLIAKGLATVPDSQQPLTAMNRAAKMLGALQVPARPPRTLAPVSKANPQMDISDIA